MLPKLTTCTFCGVGCGIYLETAGNRIVGAYPSMSHPANQGRICVRGWHVHEVASSPDRLTSPLAPEERPASQTVSWDEALGFVAARLKEIRDQHGPDSIAFLDSPRCSNEEAYLLQKLARAVIGTNNVDHGAGVYCNNSVNVLLDMIGVAAATNSIGELARSERHHRGRRGSGPPTAHHRRLGHPRETQRAPAHRRLTRAGTGSPKAPTSSCKSNPAPRRSSTAPWPRSSWTAA